VEMKVMREELAEGRLASYVAYTLVLLFIWYTCQSLASSRASWIQLHGQQQHCLDQQNSYFELYIAVWCI